MGGSRDDGVHVGGLVGGPIGRREVGESGRVEGRCCAYYWVGALIVGMIDFFIMILRVLDIIQMMVSILESFQETMSVRQSAVDWFRMLSIISSIGQAANNASS